MACTEACAADSSVGAWAHPASTAARIPFIQTVKCPASANRLIRPPKRPGYARPAAPSALSGRVPGFEGGPPSSKWALECVAKAGNPGWVKVGLTLGTIAAVPAPPPEGSVLHS